MSARKTRTRTRRARKMRARKRRVRKTRAGGYGRRGRGRRGRERRGCGARERGRRGRRECRWQTCVERRDRLSGACFGGRSSIWSLQDGAHHRGHLGEPREVVECHAALLPQHWNKVSRWGIGSYIADWGQKGDNKGSKQEADRTDLRIWHRTFNLSAEPHPAPTSHPPLSHPPVTVGP